MSLFNKIYTVLKKELHGKVDNIEQLIAKLENIPLNMINSQGTACEKHINDFIWIEHFRNKTFFHTLEDVYTISHNEVYITEMLGDNFVELRKNILVNVDRIVNYHSYKLELYFDAEHTKTINITGIKMKEYIIKKLGKERDLDKDNNNLQFLIHSHE